MCLCGELLGQLTEFVRNRFDWLNLGGPDQTDKDLQGILDRSILASIDLIEDSRLSKQHALS